MLLLMEGVSDGNEKMGRDIDRSLGQEGVGKEGGEKVGREVGRGCKGSRG